MGDVKFVCHGTCGGSVSEQEFEQGKNVCGMEDCTHFGKPLVKDTGDDEEVE